VFGMLIGLGLRKVFVRLGSFVSVVESSGLVFGFPWADVRIPVELCSGGCCGL